MSKHIIKPKKLIVYSLLMLLGSSFVVGYFIFKQLFVFKARLNYAYVQNVTIAYYTRGNGEPIILLEGFGMTMQDWDPLLLKKLSQNHQLIIFDYPTIGLSTGDVTNLSETELADAVVGLMDRLKINKAHLLGWSMGSFVAQVVAEKYPYRVDKLVLVSTAPGGGQTINNDSTVSNTIQNNLAGSWKEVYVPFMFPSTAYRETQSYLQRISRATEEGESPPEQKVTPKTLAALENAFADQQQEQMRYDGLSTIKSPTLVISGEKDILLVPENARKVVSRIPHAQLIIIPDAGHAVLFQDVATFSTLVNNFLQ